MKYILTGSSSGLGNCLAHKLILKGQVLGISRSNLCSKEFSHSEVFKNLNYDFSIHENTEAFESLIQKIKNFIDNESFTLILNAASFYSSENRLSYSSLNTLFKVNVFSLISLVHALECSKLTRIFIINSISGLIGNNHQHEYSASKHAVMGFARSLAKSAKNSNYDVMCINPGGMKTELWKNYNQVDTSDFLSPEVVADVCISLISIPQRTFIEFMSILPPSDV
jgi:3-oxoacyl-[acyl-carrier protein] reductase